MKIQIRAAEKKKQIEQVTKDEFLQLFDLKVRILSAFGYRTEPMP